MIQIWHGIYRLLAFSGTLTVVTLLVSFVALLVYYKQRSDRRRDAAGIILREIMSAEDQIPKARSAIDTMKNRAGLPKEKVQVMAVSSWARSQHYLAKVLPQDSLKVIDEFYANCQLLDEALTRIDASFYENVDQVRRNQFRVGARLVEERVRAIKLNPDNNSQIAEANDKVINESVNLQRAFDSTYATSTSYYSEKIIKDAEEFLSRLPNDLSQQRVGQKLRRAQKGFLGRLFQKKDL